MHTHRPLASLLLALGLAGCTDDTGGGNTLPGTANTGGQGTSLDESTDTGTPTTGSSSPTVATSLTTETTLPPMTSTSDTTPDATTTTVGDDTTGPPPETSMTSMTGDPTGDPTGDLCAGQDDPPPDVVQPGGLNEDPLYIQVYDNNVENLLTAGEKCPGDWTDLIYYMDSYKPSPDLFLVQQVSGSAQLDTLVTRMNDELVGKFAGVIAQGTPDPPQASPCGQEKSLQTNAIIYRVGRFDMVGEKHVFTAFASDGNTGCIVSPQARTKAVMIKLHDKIADKDVTVASVHWSTVQGMGADPACAEKNIVDVDEKLHMPGFEADLYIFGGDFNEADRKDDKSFRDWYLMANGNLGGPLNYRDPIYRMCEPLDIPSCLDDNWTTANRIDMIFAQDRNGCRAKTRHAHTITYNEADDAAKAAEGSDEASLDYSEHRGIRTEVYYQ